jgi:hypothetical protein
MRFRCSPALLAIALTLVVGCGAEEVPTGPDAAPEIAGQGSVATGMLVVNEVYPRGAGPDWIELLNRGDEPLDLCGFFVTDSLDRLDHYLPLGGTAPPDACSETLLAPGGYLVVYADGDTAAGPDHAPFKLGMADEAHVVTTQGIPVDSFVYLHPSNASGQSLSRTPNGAGLFYLTEPSPGAANPEVTP